MQEKWYVYSNGMYISICRRKNMSITGQAISEISVWTDGIDMIENGNP